MKFYRTDYPTIHSGLVVRYQIDSERYDGEINASRDGVSICGRWPIMSVGTAAEISAVIGVAYAQSLSIAEGRGALERTFGGYEYREPTFP